mmetsp:Transcript_4469/g.13226  ORF Transcript_4469/g.13226 Transcript_4469/m.13226 type:complete len:772 (-) Transcript_4469:14-2329(-)
MTSFLLLCLSHDAFQHLLFPLLAQELKNFGDRLLSADLVVPRSDVDGTMLLLLRPYNQDVVKLIELGVPNLLLHCQVPNVSLDEELCLVEALLHLECVVVGRAADRHNHDLLWRHPEGPLACKVLRQDCDHPLKGAHDGPVDNNRRLLLSLGVHVLEAKPDGELEVQLNGGALETPSEGVVNCDIDLWAVEGTVLRVQRPPLALICLPVVQASCESSLGFIPVLDVSQESLGSRGQGQVIIQAKSVVNLLEHVEIRLDLTADLVLPAEDVSIVLNESPHPCEATESTAVLVSVEDAKLRIPQWQLSEGMVPVRVQHAMARAVHGLHAPLLLLHVKVEHVLLVVPGVPRGVPQVKVENIRRRDLVITVSPVLLFHKVQELVVDPGSVRLEEARSGGDRVEEEQILLRADHAVVTLLGLLNPMDVLLQELLVREGHSVHSVQGGVLHVSSPVSSRHLVHLEGFDQAGVRDVGSPAQIAEGSVPVQGNGAALRQTLDHLHLEGVLLKHVKGLLPGDDCPLENLLLLDNPVNPLGQLLPVLVVQGLVAHEAIVVEALFNGGPDRQVRAVLQLQRLAQDVGGGVPVRVLALRRVKSEDLQLAVSLERSEDVPVLPVHLGDDGFLPQALADSGGHVLRGGDVTHTVPRVPVGQGNLDGHVLLRSLLRVKLGSLEVLLKELDALLVVRLLHIGVRRLSGNARAPPTLPPLLSTSRGRRRNLVLRVLLSRLDQRSRVRLPLSLIPPPARHPPSLTGSLTHSLSHERAHVTLSLAAMATT